MSLCRVGRSEQLDGPPLVLVGVAAQLARKQVLMAELEHRTKNNFALVAALLEIQKKREKDPRLDVAFDDAIRRVRTFAEASSSRATPASFDDDDAMSTPKPTSFR